MNIVRKYCLELATQIATSQMGGKYISEGSILSMARAFEDYLSDDKPSAPVPTLADWAKKKADELDTAETEDRTW
jgi:hypothetical protein